MECASPELIAELLNINARELQKRLLCDRQAANTPPRASKDRRRRCQCGRCRECVDNARWERIFAEKFADPNYYNRLEVRAESPLASL